MKKFFYFLFLLVTLGSCAKSVAVEELKPKNNYHAQRVGASARDLLTEERFTSLKIEVQYMPGFEPDAQALEAALDFLEDHLHKPGGIRLLTREIPATGDSVLTTPMVGAIEQANRTAYNDGSELAIYFLYTNGYSSEARSLGQAYRTTSAVLYGRNIWENSNAFKKPSRTDLETRVLLHELGHLLGLVNVGTPLTSDHKDNEHGKHCLNRNCLMYYLTDTEDPSFLLRKPKPVLDKACLDDLIANGGKYGTTRLRNLEEARKAKR
jgi:hypothetical protein